MIRTGLEPGISGSQGKRPNHLATLPPHYGMHIILTALNKRHNPLVFFTDKPLSPFRKPGWIVLVCLIAVILGLLAIAAIHARTRKKIGSHCCGKYGELSTEGDTTSVLVEGHHDEPATEEPISE